MYSDNLVQYIHWWSHVLEQRRADALHESRELWIERMNEECLSSAFALLFTLPNVNDSNLVEVL